MFTRWRNYRRQRLLQRRSIAPSLWQEVTAQQPLLKGLNLAERQRLQEYSILFMEEKAIVGAQGLIPNPQQRLTIALQATLPVLALGFDWLAGWREVILYPSAFIVDGEEIDEAGVVHRYREVRSGEAWQHGAVILGWSEICEPSEGSLVIHEIAHKLDARSGSLDGMPPLPPDLSPAHWIATCTRIYQEMEALLDAGAEPLADPYAAENPAEFFAVFSELFFTAPGFFTAYYPELYSLFRQFYRQDPAARLKIGVTNG